MPFREKGRKACLQSFRETLSPVHIESKSRRIAAISCDFERNAAEPRLCGGESGIRTRPFLEPSCCQGDGENPCEHSHSNTISFPSYLSNVARFNCASVFLELMELMHPFLLQWNLYATAIPGKRFIGGPPSGSNASGLEAVTVLEETIHF